jgi:hypothetical protein
MGAIAREASSTVRCDGGVRLLLLAILGGVGVGTSG